MRKCIFIFSLLAGSIISFGLMPSCNIIHPNPDDDPKKDTTHNPIDTTITPKDTTQTPDQQRDLDYLYDISSLPEIIISVTEKDWNTYLSNFDANPNNDLYVPASWTFTKNGVTYHRDSVGLRPRGNTSRRRPEVGNGNHSEGNQWQHAHFGIKFTEYVTGERFFGADRLILKWFKEDAMYCREVYCFDLFRRFGVWSAPRASYCRFSIHVEGDSKPVYMGVYELLENPRKGWMREREKTGHIPDENGNMWKCAWGADLSDASTGRMGVSDDYNSYVYDLKTNKDKLSAAKQELSSFISEMTKLASGSEELKAYLEAHMDVDLFLRATAVDVMVGSFDDYWYNQNNFFMYFDSNHKMYFIPFDFDNTLGTSVGIDPGTTDPLHWGPRDGSRIPMRKVLSIKEYEDRYKSYLRELASSDDLFGKEGSQARIRTWHNMISKYIANDTHEDEQIIDKPASWGNFGNYRLLENGNNNFFEVRIKAVETYAK